MDWLDKVTAIKNRTIKFLLAALVFTLLSPISPVVANGEVPISISAIEGVTPPIAGATPVTSITENEEFTGTVSWSTIDGPLLGNFETSTIYAATIILTPKTGFTYGSLGDDFFIVEGSSRTFFEAETGEVNAIFRPLVGDASEFMDESFGSNGKFSVKSFFGESPLNESNTAVGPIKVDRIAVDSQDRIVVLASFYDENDIDNHILFRLNADGSYDNNFGASGPSLRTLESDSSKHYVLVTTTCISYKESLDLEIVSQDKILVMLSGSAAEGSCAGAHHNLVTRYLSDGSIDETFAEEGVIGSLLPQSGFPEGLYSDLNVDALGRIVVASLSYDDPFAIFLERFTSSGLPDLTFGQSGETFALVSYPEDGMPSYYRTVQIIADGASGYIIAFTGEIFYDNSEEIFSQLIRLDEFGDLDEDFVPPLPPGSDSDSPPGPYIVPYFFVTDLVADGSTGFIMSGTFVFSGNFNESFNPQDLFGIMIRFNLDGAVDTEFSGAGNDPYMSPNFSINCTNSALLRSNQSSNSFIGVIVADYCGYGESQEGRVKAFSSSGSFQGDFAIEETADIPELQLINQLIRTSTGKILTLTGVKPTMGYLAYGFEVYSCNQIDSSPCQDVDWSNATITRYELPNLLIAPPDESLGISGPEQVVGVVGIPINPFSFTVSGGTGTETITVTSGYALPEGLTLSSAGLISGTPTASGTTTTSFTVTDSSNETLTAYIEFVFTLDGRPSAPTPPPAPTPVPYLTTLTTPKLNLKDGKLICTPGTYNAGYTLNGVTQVSTTALFTPSTFTYNLLINGIAQASLTVTSNNSSHSWSMPTASAGALLTCSVTVTANGVTNTDRSSDNATAITTASLTHSNSLAAANTDYSAALAANTKAYQKALVDNRAKWRSDTEKIRTDYYAERDRIKSLPPTKLTRALSSAALKSYTTAIKKSAADYKASKPAALAAKEAADKAALDAKSAAIAKANATYATFIESIGYGVLIP